MWGASKLIGLDHATFLIFHLGIWSICDFILARRIERDVQLTMPIDWLLRELLALPLWLHTALGKTVLWRGKKLALQPGGLLES